MRMLAFVVLDGAGRRWSGFVLRMTTTPPGSRRQRLPGYPLVELGRGVSGIAGADRRVASNPYVCVLGAPRPGALAQTGRTSSTVFVGRHLVVRALLREPAAVNTNWTRSTDRRCPRARTRHLPAMPADLRGDVAEQRRIGGGTLRTIARHSPGAAAPTSRSRACLLYTSPSPRDRS